MILVIPLLKLENGKNLLVIKGKAAPEEYYKKLSEFPIELCKLLRSENYKTIHIDVVDSIDNNLIILNKIANSLDIPIQVKANFKSIDQCKNLLENGIYRIIIDELLIIRRDKIREMIKEYTPSRIIAFVQFYNNVINFENLNKSFSVIDYISFLKTIGIRRIVLSNKEWNKKTINFNELKKILEIAKMRITILGGISSAKQLWELSELNNYGVDSVIIGEPLYQNNFPCQNMWRKIEGALEGFDY